VSEIAHRPGEASGASITITADLEEAVRHAEFICTDM
jgi:ornithine carbamoyltransferase